MARLLGVFVMVVLLYITFLASNEDARTVGNLQNIGVRLGYYGVLTVAVGLLIISGGIDLSIGSLVGLSAVALAFLLQYGVNPWLAAGIVCLGGVVIGSIHGLLVTLLRLQPFLVTVCGMFIYRGLARFVTKDQPVSASLEDPDANAKVENMRVVLVSGLPGGVPSIFLLLLAIAVILGLLLHGTRYGRYLFAIGANEEAARYAGISTWRYKILAYVLCSTLACLGGVLYLLRYNGASPTEAGYFFELYAITGAVLGGCSLRGGEGNIAGMVLGAAVLPLLMALCQFSKFSNTLEYVVIGSALLIGTITDEVLRRLSVRRG